MTLVRIDFKVIDKLSILILLHYFLLLLLSLPPPHHHPLQPEGFKLFWYKIFGYISWSCYGFCDILVTKVGFILRYYSAILGPTISNLDLQSIE